MYSASYTIVKTTLFLESTQTVGHETVDIYCILINRLYYLFSSPLPNVLNGTCDTSDCPILHFVYKCLFTDGISSEVSRVILELTVNLIAQDKNEMDEDVSLNDEPTCELGMELLKPFIPTILMYLRSIIKIKQSGILLQLGFQVLSW